MEPPRPSPARSPGSPTPSPAWPTVCWEVRAPVGDEGPVDLVVDLSSRADRPTAIYRALLEAVRSGRLVPGDRLPPTRSLARDLGVSRTTVATAYERLVAEGFLEARVGDGTYVPTVRAVPWATVRPPPGGRVGEGDGRRRRRGGHPGNLNARLARVASQSGVRSVDRSDDQRGTAATLMAKGFRSSRGMPWQLNCGSADGLAR
ncbi:MULTISPECIES: winged helix-turn-helix domain-containing protein [unclassified Nocardioides]|uniref:winged helix-turn-helix domain-containing protein n=1 Tax=unclassified Nocardioides TaxID=2615069 RepID=UPI00301428C6